MEFQRVWVIRVTALALGISGWATYLLLWLGVRLFDSVTLTFGQWGPGWLEWFENWIEPLILFGWLGFLGWALWYEFRRSAEHVHSERSPEAFRERRRQWRSSIPSGANGRDLILASYDSRTDKYSERRKPTQFSNGESV